MIILKEIIYVYSDRRRIPIDMDQLRAKTLNMAKGRTIAAVTGIRLSTTASLPCLVNGCQWLGR